MKQNTDEILSYLDFELVVRNLNFRGHIQGFGVIS